MTFDLNINRDHLLIKDYLPTKFEASGEKCSWIISCTRQRDTDIQTDRNDMCKAICPSFFLTLLLRQPCLNNVTSLRELLTSRQIRDVFTSRHNYNRCCVIFWRLEINFERCSSKLTNNCKIRDNLNHLAAGVCTICPLSADCRSVQKCPWHWEISQEDSVKFAYFVTYWSEVGINGTRKFYSTHWNAQNCYIRQVCIGFF